MAKDSQKKLILIHMKMYKTITSWEAINKFGATRLSGIIHTLRKEGYNISSTRIDADGKNCVEYRLHGEDESGQFELI